MNTLGCTKKEAWTIFRQMEMGYEAVIAKIMAEHNCTYGKVAKTIFGQRGYDGAITNIKNTLDLGQDNLCQDGL
jgi:hypothetical protein